MLKIVCPFCKHEIVRSPNGGLSCTNCQAVFPKRSDWVDILLTEEEWHKTLPPQDDKKQVTADYSSVRRTSPLNIFYYDWWIGQLLKQVPFERKNKSLVELMCGEAEICRRLTGEYVSGVGIDLNKTLSEQAAKELKAQPHIQIICGNATRLPLMDQSVDVVVIQGGLHHARPFLKEILDEIYRVLKPDGIFVVSEPSNDNPLIQKIREWQYKNSSLQGNDPDEDGFTREELSRVFQKSNLTLTTYQQFGFLAYPLIGNTDLIPYFRNIKFLFIGKLLIGIDRLLASIPLIKTFGFASIFTAKKNAPRSHPW